MRPFGFTKNLLRPETGHDAHRVSYLELFFDLVFVFAITQVSHLLIVHPNAEGLGKTLLVGFAVWWVWVYTTWVANWLNPETGWVRGLFIGMMLFGIVMSATIPEAFGEKGLVFAVAMAVFQVGRSVFTIFAFGRRLPAHAVNFIRISLWLTLGGVVWIAGGLASPEQRIWIWLAALLIDYAGPRLRFWVPGLGGSPVETWNISGEHMSERVNLFIIIALGESIIITGSQFGENEFTGVNLLAFLSAFVSTVLMFLLFFNHGERSGSQYLASREASSRGLTAQIAYTYIPALLVLGVVFTAVADELVIAHPLGAGGGAEGGESHAAGGFGLALPFAGPAAEGPGDGWTAAIVCGSSAIYLLGNLLFKRAVGFPWLWSHLLGVGALGLVFLTHTVVPPLAVSWLTNTVLLAVVVADERVFRRLPGVDDAVSIG